MLSPYKLCSMDENSLLISSDNLLANNLNQFFDDKNNEFLWTLNTVRQETTYALRNTQSIVLRKLKLNQRLNSTLEYNQVMEVEDTSLVDKYPIFQTTVESIDNMFRSTGASSIEYGRIFFSRFNANSDIDEHTDEGKYFSYFDRFHFVISSPENSIFHIRDEDIYLKVGHFYWVNNHVPHWLKNNGDFSRINLIVDARLI